MKKIILKNLIVISTLTLFSTSLVSANDKINITISHILTQIIQGNNMDHKEVVTNDVKSISHNFALNIIDNVFNDSSYILDGASSYARLEVDEIYKCSLQGDYKNKECR